MLGVIESCLSIIKEQQPVSNQVPVPSTTFQLNALSHTDASSSNG